MDRNPWVIPPQPEQITVAEPDPTWPSAYARVEAALHDLLGETALQINHVGSTAVPGLPAKPILDIDVIVADPEDEDGYLPALQSAGFVHRVREPWWGGHRMLRGSDPTSNLHVFSFEADEPHRHLVLRDWLRTHPADAQAYAAAKRDAAAATNAVSGSTVMDYNRAKEAVLVEILDRALNAS